MKFNLSVYLQKKKKKSRILLYSAEFELQIIIKKKQLLFNEYFNYIKLK